MNYIAVKGYTNSVLSFKLERGTVISEQSGIAPDLLQQLIDNGVVIEGDTLPQPPPKPTRRKSSRTKSSKEIK